MSAKARQASRDQWLEDLAALRRHAKARFADVSWVDESGTLIYAHKVIMYSRAAGSFQQRYLAPPPTSLHESTVSLHDTRSASRRSLTPTASAASHDYNPSSSSHDRCTSPSSIMSAVSSVAHPLPLSGTDPALFEACLDYLYTGEKGAEGVAVLFDGFGDRVRENESEVDGTIKLREDLNYAWRSQLFFDVTVALDDTAETSFRAHRAILCSRSPYFASLLLGSYGDSSLNHFTLPSPPFTSASLTFILGYIYSGTLEFSKRKYDLATAFEIWRGAAFLGLQSLQEEVEVHIEEMANLQRAGRIYNFALAPDVNSQRLARCVAPWVLDRFGDVWGGPHVGNLEYEAQKKLVRDVCGRIKPESVTGVAKMLLGLKKKLELEKAMWAAHVGAMLGAIEDELVLVLGRSLGQVVLSKGFVELVDGVGFSTDVLEWILELLVRGLREQTAPEAYQALVGSVLLREAGILIDAKVLVEDARNGILKYIQRKWIGIRAARAFDDLEPWCLKELSDEIEVPIDDLLADAPRFGNIASRAAMRPSPKANGTIRPTAPQQRHPLPVTRPPTAAATAPATTRTPRPSTTSNASRMTTATTATRTPSVASTSRASTAVPPRPTTGSATADRAGAVSAAGSRGAPAPSGATRPGRPPPSASPSPAPPLPSAVSSSAPLALGPARAVASAPNPAPTPSTSSTPSATRNGASARPPTLSAKSSAASLASTAASVRARSAASTRPNAAAASPSASASASTSNGVPARPRASVTSTTRRPPSLAPSLASRPSTSSLASTASTPRPTTTTRTAAKPLTPAISRPRTTSTTPSLAPKTTPASVKGKERAVEPAPTRRPPSVSSTKSTATLRRPPSATSITSVRAPPASSRPSSVASTKASTRKPTTSVSSVKSPVKSVKANGTPTPRPTPNLKAKASAVEPPLPSSSAVQKPGLPGTTLLSGIPCIVTVRVDRPMRFKAVVRYIGGVLWGEGEWVGVEVAESAIPPEARELAWNDGEVDGVTYFKIAPSSGRSSGRTTPVPSDNGHDGRPSAATSSNGGSSVGGSGVSSLRPPSRRQRRSSSSEPEREGGPRKGLFVRPNQIVYVL